MKSKLDSIMTTYLRAQHRQCAAPMAACAPFSLLEQHACPEPRHLLNAPLNLAARLARRERSRHPRGGPGGYARDRHFVYGRFRPIRAFRDRGEGPMFTCVTFVGADGDRALVGSDVSELLLYDVANGDLLERHDAQHADGDPRSLRAAPLACPKTLVLSCGSEEVHLWDVANMGTGPLHTFEGSCGAAFDADGSRIVVVGEDLAGTARLVDVATGVTVRAFAPSADGDRAPRLPRSFRHADVSFSPGDGGLFLWGNTLWDARLREPVKRFDRFSDGGGACFHPRGNEAILNSEVWDLRTNRLVRSVASLDGTRLCWTGSGDVAVATYRLPPETDIFHHVRRCKHPLRASFRTLDAADYSEICTVELERAVLDACWDAGTDALCATVEYDHADTRDSVVRVHEVGRRRPEEDDSDAEEEDPMPTRTTARIWISTISTWSRRTKTRGTRTTTSPRGRRRRSRETKRRSRG